MVPREGGIKGRARTAAADDPPNVGRAVPPPRSKTDNGSCPCEDRPGTDGRRPLSFHALRSGGPGTAARCLGRVGAPLLTWAFDAAPRQTGLGQPIARSLSMACPRLEPSAPSPGDGDAAGSILARSHVLVASSNKLMPSIQLRVSRRRTVLAFRRDCMSSAASPYRVERVGDITLAPPG